MLKLRKFSVPYNGTEPVNYIMSMQPFREHIENFFFGLTDIAPNHNENFDKSYINNTYQFIKLAHKYCYKTIMTLNASTYGLNNIQTKEFVINILVPFVNEYHISGFICTDFIMAKYIHEIMPTIELHTSCNCFQWNIRQMKIWQELAGISVFNPPREILRTPDKLKEMHDAGFKLKCILNESCLYGCPMTINHWVANSGINKISNYNIDCIRSDMSNALKSNCILPRWLNILDDYVDIYKIAGRMNHTKYLVKLLKLYITGEDPQYFNDLANGGIIREVNSRNLKIPCSVIPDKLLTCQCNDCDKCGLCKSIIEKLSKEQNIDLLFN